VAGVAAGYRVAVAGWQWREWMGRVLAVILIGGKLGIDAIADWPRLTWIEVMSCSGRFRTAAGSRWCRSCVAVAGVAVA
jgi:hypothetical protein